MTLRHVFNVSPLFVLLCLGLFLCFASGGRGPPGREEARAAPRRPHCQRHSHLPHRRFRPLCQHRMPPAATSRPHWSPRRTAALAAPRHAAAAAAPRRAAAPRLPPGHSAAELSPARAAAASLRSARRKSRADRWSPVKVVANAPLGPARARDGAARRAAVGRECDPGAPAVHGGYAPGLRMPTLSLPASRPPPLPPAHAQPHTHGRAAAEEASVRLRGVAPSRGLGPSERRSQTHLCPPAVCARVERSSASLRRSNRPRCPHLTSPYLTLPYQVSGLSSTCGAAGCQAPTRAREPNPPQHPTPPLSPPLRTPHPPSSTSSPRPTAALSKCSPFPNRSPGSRTSSPSTTGTAASEPPRGREATSCPSCRRTSSRRWSGTAARGPRVVAA